MVSVQSVYETVKNLANKDQKGFVTPEMFNSFAKAAQLKIYHEIFQEVIEGKKLRRSQVDAGRNLSLVERNKTDISVFAEKVAVPKVQGAFEKPGDLYSIISIRTKGVTRKSTHIVYDEDKIGHILNSTLSAPTADFPVALVSKDIELFPTSISRIDLAYYRTPVIPLYAAYVVGTGADAYEVFNADASVDFELPTKYEPELIDEIANMIGINVRDAIISNYASAEDTEA
jgi:hypothetical protein